MTPDEAVRLLRRGRCTAAKLAEAGCVTCEATDEAIRCLVAEGARGIKSGAAWRGGTDVLKPAEAIACEVVP